MRWNRQNYSGWGRVLWSEADITRPERQGALSELVASTDHVLGYGSLRSYGDAALTRAGRALSTARLDRFLKFDQSTGVLDAEAGLQLGEILRVLAPRGWVPTVLPGTGKTTIAGAIANDVHGKNHHIVGSFGEHLDQITLITADGKTRKTSPTRESQLFQATVGGVGQTGLITAARIRLAPCPSLTMSVREDRMDNLAEFIARFESETKTFQVGWIDALASGDDLGRGIFEAADFSVSANRDIKTKPAKSLPLTLPGITLSAPIVRAFNYVYRTRVPEGGRTVERPLSAFFFPLDKIDNWNLAYGKSGFHQFQCVVPLADAESILRQLLSQVAKGGLASPLAVIKKMGPGRAGMLSFPMEGYSLALDIPNRKGAADLMAELNSITIKAGGRVYLAKDSTAEAQMIEDMYPDIDTFRTVVKKVDPEGKFDSALARRLNLRGSGL